jgi:hypothetical protein
VDALAALAAGGWCSLNFWRCRHAHCVVTGPAWLALSIFAFTEAGIGRSLIAGDEQLVFLGVLAAALCFEGVWYLARRTNAVTASGQRNGFGCCLWLRSTDRGGCHGRVNPPEPGTRSLCRPPPG